MAIRQFDQHDHPEADLAFPQVGCGICGRAVQLAGDLVAGAEHWDALEADAQRRGLQELATWSHEHARTHTQDQHDAHQRRLEAAP